MAKAKMITTEEEKTATVEEEVKTLHIELTELEVYTLRMLDTVVAGSSEGLRGVFSSLVDEIKAAAGGFGKPVLFQCRRREMGLPTVVSRDSRIHFEDDSLNEAQRELDGLVKAEYQWDSEGL